MASARGVCLTLLVLLAGSPAHAAPWPSVSLTASPASGAPIMTSSGMLHVTLRASLQPGSNPLLRTDAVRYSFWAGSQVLQTDGASPTTVWIPGDAGPYPLKVVARHLQGTQVVWQSEKVITYEVKRGLAFLKLEVTPPGQAVAGSPPPVPLTLKATAGLTSKLALPGLVHGGPPALASFFIFSVNPGSGLQPVELQQTVNGLTTTWSPRPPMPVAPGTYVIKASVQLSPTEGPAAGRWLADAAVEITNYQVTAAPAVSFTDLYPVYSHPRCTNCHGGVDPATGHDHPQTTAACSTCHSVPGWAKAPTSFLNGTTPKSASEICTIVKNDPHSASKAAFVDFLQTFGPIGWAFMPTSPGGGALSAPPVSKDYFVARSGQWVDAGKPCR
jgi:hypothetical protein